jgi:transcriptional regulator with PAS, ATPase and Fis domain
MREDFYYRINTVPILVPPLRSRKEDLPLLIDHFINQSGDGEKTVELPANVYITLGEHHWPGNVRELQNVLRRYLTLHEISFNPSFAPEVFSARQTSPQPVSETVALQANVPISSTLATTEKELLLAKLNECRWHIGKTAAALGISRRTLQRRLNRHNLH